MIGKVGGFVVWREVDCKGGILKDEVSSMMM
jgi:hypothetical protein